MQKRRPPLCTHSSSLAVISMRLSGNYLKYVTQIVAANQQSGQFS